MNTLAHSQIKKALIICFLAMLIANSSYGQVFTSSNFPYQFSTGIALESMVGATVATTSSSTPSSLIAFGGGFNFWYAGSNYTSVSVSPDGWVRLGNAGTTSTTGNFSTTNNQPIIAPYWDDLNNNLSPKYKMIGTTPNRKFVVEWNADPSQSTNAQFQLWLNESTNRIDFVYGYVGNNTGNYSVGCGALINGENTFVNLLTDTFAYQTIPVYNTTILTNYLQIQTGACYSFIPVLGGPGNPSGVQFTNVSAGCLNLEWTDQSTTEAYYTIQRSTDNINFILLKTIGSSNTLTTGSVYQFNDTNLTPLTQYFYRVESNSFCSSLTGSITIDTTTNAPSLSGIKKIPTDYPSIYEALEAIKCERLSGPLTLELEAGYTDIGEIFPLRINEFLYTTSVNTITIRPDSGATGLLISDSIGIIFDIVNAVGITIDGRPDGLGANNELTLENKSLSGIVIRYQKNAQLENLLHVNIKGCGNILSSGSVVFGASTLFGDNDYINVIGCHFTNSGNSLTGNHIYSKGLAGASNDHILVDSCWFTNYGVNGINQNSAAVQVLQYNSDWTFTNNHFYEEVSVVLNNGNLFSLRIWSSMGGNFIINNNYFGGSAPYCSGSPMDISPKSGRCFTLAANLTTTCHVQGNVFRNMVINVADISSANYRLLEVDSANAEVGTLQPNLFGAMDSANSIIYYSGGSNYMWVMTVVTSGVKKVCNNEIGGITMIGVGNGSGGLTLLTASGDSCFVVNNKLGSSTIPRSISLTTPETLIGISGGSNNYALIKGNSICNFYKKTLLTGGNNRVEGIISGTTSSYSPGKCIIEGNKIWGLYVDAPAGEPIKGITTGTYSSLTISGNDIYDLLVVGNQTQWLYVIEYGSGTVQSGFCTIAGNNIHHVGYSGATQSTVEAINAESGIGGCRIVNNMISLGYWPNSSNMGSTFQFVGIRTYGNAKVFHNSVHIGGLDSITNNVSYCMIRQQGGLNDSIVNNIFVNDRTHGAWTSSCEHILYATTSLGNPPTAYVNFNLYHIADPYMGIWSDQTNFSATTFPMWQSYGYDLNSYVGNPNFINPAGDTSTIDLHIAAYTPAEGTGLPISWIQYDHDSDYRPANSPTDIGADAGNFFITNINDLQEATLQVAPNPTNQFISISFPLTSSGTVTIVDVLGHELYRNYDALPNAGAMTLDVSFLPPGLYFVNYRDDKMSVGTSFVKSE